ncbi:hypothetical protein DL764_001073 [Monosporascus ibericus]|uniref:Uncharacterized protein n=1 Tax=Monosporascus ibericus TaxID=155417 RepID=A0A4V1XCI0_9PEZI|nr:hypothetical protein DL764_001073 [Monosporascus ibericus]
MALVRCRPVPSVSGGGSGGLLSLRPFGDGPTCPHLQKVVTVDEHRFLHAESGGRGTRGGDDPPAIGVPDDINVDEGRDTARHMGGLEQVKINDAMMLRRALGEIVVGGGGAGAIEMIY